MIDLSAYIIDIARRLLGEPNHQLSSRTQLRFGSKGSIAVEVAGSKAGTWYDHENQVGGSGWEMLRLKGGVANGEIIPWLKRELGIEIEHNGNAAFKILARYPYRDEVGNLLFEVVRLHPKDFRQRHPNGNGSWIWKTKGVRKVLYRLPELIAAPADQWVFIVEGEKDVDNLVKCGLVATTNPGGAAKAIPGQTAKPKWRRDYNEFFRGKRVCILPDNDACGGAHASEIARNLAPLANDLRIVQLTGVPEKGDVSDWLAAGGSAETLLRMANNAPPFKEDTENGSSGATFGIRAGNLLKPTIRITAGELARIVDEVDQALAAADGNLYAYGNKLVQIVTGEIRTTQGKEKSLRLSTITPPSLLYQISVAAVFEKYNAKVKGWVTTDCPHLVAATYIDRESWQMPTLLGIVTCPTLRPDGSVLSTPGYDEQTGLFFDPGGVTFPPVPERPTKAQAEAALKELKAPIEKFKFVNPQSRSVALSGFITTVVRRALDTAPMHCFDAPVAGSGKSLLGDVASVIVTGHRAAVTGADNREELEKKLAASLLGGDTVIMLDNMDQPVGGQLLCQMLTQTKVKPREFGKLKNIEVPSNAMIFANGNNLVIEGDVTRRTLVGRIDPEVERPEMREFDFHPVQMAIERRPRLVCAALTIVRAGIVARDKPKIVKLGSFERWSELVREALIWLGEADPVIVMDDVRQADPKLQTLRTMMEAWHQTIGINSEQSCQKLAEIAQSRNAYSQELDNPNLHAVCITIARDRTGSIDLYRLGVWFRKNKERVLALAEGAEYRFTKSNKTTAGLTWWKLERVNGTTVAVTGPSGAMS